MRFFRKVVGFLGFGKEDDNNSNPNANNDDNNSNTDDNRGNKMNVDPVHVGPRRGFGVQVQVPVGRPVVGPILMPCSNGDGGLQGFRWYAERLRIDEDGDVADEFFHEVPPDLSHHNVTMHDPSKSFPRFLVKNYERRPQIKKQQVTPDGKFQHLVVVHGREQWV